MDDPLSDSLQEFDAAVHALEAAVSVQPALAQVLFGDTREWRKLLFSPILYGPWQKGLYYPKLMELFSPE